MGQEWTGMQEGRFEGVSRSFGGTSVRSSTGERSDDLRARLERMPAGTRPCRLDLEDFFRRRPDDDFDVPATAPRAIINICI